ncbi:hypothetical protein DM01DRAFT_1408993 [Hesseltinella vesiculosa]|uniref:Beta-trefoil n=1 Tax=Hesseltinella vesiculosa TaxID=101127 RepID=A0A1X2GC59_9FUNG|nr:hypothetical protein DM01DRAFT_1408993 [Hesseltinella vesiculosa]
MEHSDSPIISQQVFGSSKKIQFIGLSPVNSLLTVIDKDQPIHLPRPSTMTSPKRHMSIESMLTNDDDTQRPVKRLWDDLAPVDKRPRYTPPLSPPPSAPASVTSPPALFASLPQRQTMTVTCYHAVVAQKSYGSEKRFLCPPPMVYLQQDQTQSPLISLSVVADHQDRPVEQHGYAQDHQPLSFKYLHVTGTAKTKQFMLKLNLQQGVARAPFASSFSHPISIISKPSKKTAKARNISSCIFTTSQVSLFNRINSQTVRTKYLTSDPATNQLCAKNLAWSAFDIILVKQPPPPTPALANHQYHYHHLHQPSVSASGPPLTYGSEIILKHPSGVCTPRVIIRKVDKAMVTPDAAGPVSQMQKVALQLASSAEPGQSPLYLSANGQLMHQPHQDVSKDQQDTSAWLDYSPSTCSAQGEQMNDYLCWTIVGIAKFQYTVDAPAVPCAPTTPRSDAMASPMLRNNSLPSLSPSVSTSPALSYQSFSSPGRHDVCRMSPPPSPPRTLMPLPMVSSVHYHQHHLSIRGRHLTQPPHQESSASPQLLEFWLGGTHRPLPCVGQPVLDTHPGAMELTLAMPPTQDLLIAHHDLLINLPSGQRSMELPLLLVRKDSVVYHSGKALVCHVEQNGDTRWSVLDVSVSKA